MSLTQFFSEHDVGLIFCAGMAILGLVLVVDGVRSLRQWKFANALTGIALGLAWSAFVLDGPYTKFGFVLLGFPLAGLAILIGRGVLRRRLGKRVLVNEMIDPNNPDRVVARHWLTWHRLSDR